jgi:PIN domain nuclease of toxin-antitoxin system
LTRSVVDASAVIAFVNRESGWDAILTTDRPVISAVNYAEVASYFTKAGLKVDDARDALDPLNLMLVSFDVEQAEEVARLRPTTLRAGLSLGDRACLALAVRMHLPVMTADRLWADLDVGVPITLIR